MLKFLCDGQGTVRQAILYADRSRLMKVQLLILKEKLHP